MIESLRGRSVIVTGGSRGIGRGMVVEFARAGARVLVTGRDASALDATVAAAAGLDGSVTPMVVDAASEVGCSSMAQVASDRHGGIDILCTNAGIFPSSRVADMKSAELVEVMTVNFLGTVYAVQACLPHLERSGHGRVIMTSSITGPLTGFPGWSHYGASKAAQLGFMRTAAIELAPRGVTLNAILPGNIRTEGVIALGEDYQAQMEAVIPQGRLGTCEDVAHVALFLASDEASYITGQTVVVDGGQLLPESTMALEAM
jgi:3-oxoacyl-[acyl-carrier protein] reductase